MTLTKKKLEHVERVRVLNQAAEDAMRDRTLVRCNSDGCARWTRSGQPCDHCRSTSRTRVHGASRRQLNTRDAEHRMDRRHRFPTVLPAARAFVSEPASIPRRSVFRALSRLFRGGDR